MNVSMNESRSNFGTRFYMDKHEIVNYIDIRMYSDFFLNNYNFSIAIENGGRSLSLFYIFNSASE